MLKLITPAELVADEVLFRVGVEMMKFDPHGLTLPDVLKAVEAQNMVLWSWGEGLIVTQFIDFPAGRELMVTHLGGRGYLKRLAELRAEMEEIARKCGCRWMSGIVARQGLVKEYLEQGGEFAAAYMIKEI